MKRKPVTLYGPTGDFNSTVKMHEGKIKIYLCRQQEQVLYVQTLWVFSYPFSLCFLQRYFPGLCIESESALYIEQNSPS